jgi:hypothetical protein
VRQHAELTDEEKTVLAGKFPITTLDRLLSTPAIREKIGVEIRDDKLLTALPAGEAIKALTRIVLDLAEKKINVTQLKKVSQQTDYISKMPAKDIPDLSMKGKDFRAIEGITQSQFVSASPPSPITKQPPRPQKIPERIVVVPRACRLNVTNNNTLEIYRELGALKLKSFPNAKGKLAEFVKRLMKANRLLDGEYVEPYAGGAAIALELLFHEYVSRIHINDISRPVWAFWRSVLEHTDALCRMIRDTPRNVETWDTQKKILLNERDFDILSVGFATFFLNRTNRSCILNAGIIGGRDQTGA